MKRRRSAARAPGHETDLPVTRAEIEGSVAAVDLDELSSHYRRNHPFESPHDEGGLAGPGSYLRGEIRAEGGVQRPDYALAR